MVGKLAAPARRAASDCEALWNDVQRACDWIPPLWDLGSYIAVNPFLGFSALPIDQALGHVRDGLAAEVLPGLDHYRAQWKAGGFGKVELARAANRHGWPLPPLIAILEGENTPETEVSHGLMTFAEAHDHKHQTAWEDAVVRQISRWCGVHVSGGGTYWKLPCDGRGLFASWRDAAAVDRSLEIMGLRGWRAWVSALPQEHREAIPTILKRLGVPPAKRALYLYRILGSVYGWASYFRQSGWAESPSDPSALIELLAVRLCADNAVAELARTGAGRESPRPPGLIAHPRPVEDLAVRIVFQEALEEAYALPLLSRINPGTARELTTRPAVQAVFCIDVRSEPLRRHLEAQSDSIETRGFAGFFGLPLDWDEDTNGRTARCPAFVKPSIRLKPTEPKTAATALRGALKYLQGAAASAFNFVEVAGLGYSLGLAADALGLRKPKRSVEESLSVSLEPDRAGNGITPEQRIALARGLLKGMGFGRSLAPIVLLCGHQGQSANNAHAAGLDCGACGGHGGAMNARVAAAIFNDPAVRETLDRDGSPLPADTHFLAAVHDTSIDEIRLLDLDQVPETHRSAVDQLRKWIAEAGSRTRAERAELMGVTERSPRGLLRALGRRSADWSEVRPEWGLARNAAFIAAPRARTRGANLDGRAFLHEYDCSLDPDNSVLSSILTAPMVVASWISWQYFASTVNNETFGAGSKVLHQRVGRHGVVLGNGGDLRTGLPVQSVHSADGRWFHEPLRLQVVVEAERARIDAVIAAQPKVRELVENGWVRLFAIEPSSGQAHLRLATGIWEPVHEESGSSSGFWSSET